MQKAVNEAIECGAIGCLGERPGKHQPIGVRVLAYRVRELTWQVEKCEDV